MKRTGIYASADEMKGDITNEAYIKSLADKRGMRGTYFIQPGSGEFWEKEPEPEIEVQKKKKIVKPVRRTR